MLSLTEKISFSEYVKVSFDEQYTIIITGKANFELSFDDARIINAFKRFSGEGCTYSTWWADVTGNFDAMNIALAIYYFNQFDRNGVFRVTIEIDDNSVVSFESMTQSPIYIREPDDIRPAATFECSEFCYFRVVGNKFILETPLSDTKCTISDVRILAVIFEFRIPASLNDLQEKFPDLGDITCLFQYLRQMKIINDAEESLPVIMKQWEFHDLLFHARSRMGRHHYSYGGSMPFIGKISWEPALKQVFYEKGIDLYRPSSEEIREADVYFSEAVNNRISVRKHGIIPLSARQIGHFMYRCARVLENVKRGGYEFALRPYPSGGALYDIEFYLLINRNREFEKGLYYYHPQKHQLHLIESTEDELNRVLANTCAAYQSADLPEIVILLTSRFSRISWKYRSMAYALCLKHVGVVYQTMYLTATAMKISACAIGGGDADLFSSISKTDYYEEPLVGEFIIGSPE